MTFLFQPHSSELVYNALKHVKWVTCLSFQYLVVCLVFVIVICFYFFGVFFDSSVKKWENSGSLSDAVLKLKPQKFFGNKSEPCGERGLSIVILMMILIWGILQ